jgi:predicted dehydrogenase
MIGSNHRIIDPLWQAELRPPLPVVACGDASNRVCYNCAGFKVCGHESEEGQVSQTKIGIVGCGAVAELHANNGYAALADLVQLVAVCDRRDDRADHIASSFGSKIYHDYDEMLRDDQIEAVDLCVPHPVHASLALKALRTGRHVLVEKPIATNVADAEQMVEEAERRNLTLCVSENYPFLEPFRRAKELIEAGEIGRLVALRSHRIGYLAGIWLRDGWRQNADLAGGGMLLDQGCHYTNVLRNLGGEIQDVAAFSSTSRPDWKGEDTATLILRFASGVIGESLYCWGTRTPEVGHEAYAYGDKGSLEVAAWEPALVMHRSDLPGGKEIVVASADYAGSFASIIEDFVLATRGEQTPIMPGREGLADLRVVMAAYRSIESGKIERV